MPNKRSRIQPPSAAMLAGLPPRKEAPARQFKPAPFHGRRSQGGLQVQEVEEQKPREIGDKSSEETGTTDLMEATITMDPEQHTHTIPSNQMHETNSEGQPTTSWFKGGMTRRSTAMPVSLTRRIEQIQATGIDEGMQKRLIEKVVEKHFTENKISNQMLEVLCVGGSIVAVIAIGTVVLTYVSKLVAPTMPAMGGATGEFLEDGV